MFAKKLVNLREAKRNVALVRWTKRRQRKPPPSGRATTGDVDLFSAGRVTGRPI